MYFQINVTPKAKEKSGISHDAPEPPAILILGPFQPQTRIKLESNINTQASINLTIRNPSTRALNVKVTKSPPDERSVTLSLTEVTINPNSDCAISLSWTPRDVGSWREILQFTDGRRIKYDVALTLTCSGVKKGSTKGSTRTRVLAQSNEIRNTNDGPKKMVQASTMLIKDKNTDINSKRFENKENVSGNSNNIKSDFGKPLPRTVHTVDTNTYNVREKSMNNLDFSQFQLTPINTNHTKSGKVPNIRVLNATPSNSISHDIEQMNNVPDIRVLNATEVDFAPADASIISPRNIGDGPTLRRETYLNPEPKFCKTMGSIYETCDENFDDSLSPRRFSVKSSQIERDFSMVLNDIVNFTTPTKSISPAACSTGRKSDSDSRQFSDCDSSSPAVANNTFDIIANNSPNKSTSNGSCNTIKSPKSTCATKKIRPSRLTATFARMSQNSPTSDMPGINLVSSSPTFNVDYRRVSPASSDIQSSDDTSAKAILEADLWANADQFHPLSSSNVSRGKFNDTLEIIAEETITVTKRLKIGTATKNAPSYVATLEKPTGGIRVEISPPKKVVNNTKRVVTIKKISPLRHNKITKDKVVQHNQILRKKVQESNTLSKQRSNVSIPGVRITKLCLNNLNEASVTNKSNSVNNISISKNISKNNSNIKMANPNDVISSVRNRDPFAATMTEDPFLTHSLLYDDQWMYHQELEFTKWLNTLLTPPEHSADVETACIDVGKVWQSCRAKENVTLAETKEAVSARYHNTNTRLNTLRKAACAMFARDEVKNVLAPVLGCIEKGIFVIRQDRDLHRDIGLQKAILELLISYNPLWLRIGLEVVYGETIPLNSNNDLIGLTRFLISRFFSDPYLVQTYSHPNVISFKLPAFQSHMNKFLLKKFLLIVYFLDYAKRNKLIGHDPCLFHKKALNKDSRAILLTFAREVLSGVGDITKILRVHGYIVSHKQTYLDEYNYAVKDISSDLRDGVRLCRVMELIIGDRTLTSQCRVPSISRLQKVHNVDLALKALIKAGYQITGDIDAKSVVDGHREKTLSLLWQIIYKFQRPRFEKSAIALQKWWRAMLWHVRVKNYLSRRRNNAACVIQRVWRCYRAKKLTQLLRETRAERLKTMEKSVRIIQLRWIHRQKMLHARRDFLQMKAAAVRIQKWFKRIRTSRPYLQDLQKKRHAVIILQCHLRATIAMRRERIAFENIKQATMIIQRWWRATSLKSSTQNYYQKLRAAVTFVQSKWRAQQQMKIERNCYMKKHEAIIKIQIWWRSIVVCKRLRNDFILQKNAARVIESWWIDRKLMQIERHIFLVNRKSAIKIQQCWRRYRDTKNYISSFNSCRKATKIIQTWWRSVKHSRQYRAKRNSAIIIQQWWRALIISRITSSNFSLLRKSAIDIQKTWKMKLARREYMKLKEATRIIQTQYRNTQKMRTIHHDFIMKKKAILNIQCWWRNLKYTRECQQNYLMYKKSVIWIQIRWRAKILAKSTRQEYIKLKIATIKIQKYWRMIRMRRVYLRTLKQHKAAHVLQRRWRAKKIGYETRENYMKQKAATLLIQQRYRANKLARSTRIQFLVTKSATITIQKNWRMYKASRDFQRQKNATIIIQTRWRAQKLTMESRQSFVTLRNAVITIQRCYRAFRIGKIVRNKYLVTYQAVLVIQRYYRTTRLMHDTRRQYLEYRNAVVSVQSIWRMIQARREYHSIIQAALIIQRKWRNKILARAVRNKFLALRTSTIFIQQRFRLKTMSMKIHSDYKKLREMVIWIQRSWRMKCLRRARSAEYAAKEKSNNAAIIIQAAWRGYKVRTSQSVEIQELRQRSRQAAQAATPSTTVEYRLQAALNLFQNFTNIGQLSMCLACIDTLTRLSPKGCILFCELDLVDRLYSIFEKSNRSLPWMDVCKRCSNILITLAKLPQTAAYVRKIDEMETIVRLMTAALKYDVDLLLHLATLFWLLLNNSEFALHVKNSQRTVWLLKTLIVAATKKETSATLSKSRNKNVSIGPQPMLLPNSKPDWGLRTRRPRCFTTVQHAISVLMEIFDINPNP